MFILTEQSWLNLNLEKFRKILFSESSKLSKVVNQPRSQVTLGLAPLTNVLKGSGLRWQTALKNLDVRKQEGGEENIVYLLPRRASLAFTNPNSLAPIHPLPLFLKSDTRAKGEAKKRTLPSWTANHNPRSLLSAHNHTIEFNKENRKLNY